MPHLAQSETEQQQIAPNGTLADLDPGERAIIQSVKGDPALKRRLSVLGLVRGTEVALDFAAPLGDPRAYSVLGYQISLRNEEARMVFLQPAE